MTPAREMRFDLFTRQDFLLKQAGDSRQRPRPGWAEARRAADSLRCNVALMPLGYVTECVRVSVRPDRVCPHGRRGGQAGVVNLSSFRSLH